MNVFRILFILFFCSFNVVAQNQIGTPQILNYSNLTYKAGTQNWDSGQDKQGVMYFGNNEGLLTFNGKFWNLYPLPNKTVVRSLEIDESGRIYVGGQDEVGYFFPDGNGKLVYHSLKELLPKNEHQFADIWNICIVNRQVFFRSVSKILHLKDGLLKIVKPDTEWVFLEKAKNRLYAQERKRGLITYSNGIWKPICQDPVLNKITITSILEYGNDALLITTLKNGLFLLIDSKLIPKKTDIDQILYSDRIYCAVGVNNDWYALGTTSAGVLIIDKNGKLIQKYSFPEGLQKNNIRNVFIDHNKNLWLGLDDGIDFMAINSAIKQIYPDNNKQVTSYAMRIFNQKLYIGTSNGLFRSTPLSATEKDISLSNGTFSEVKNTKGQVWGLDEINNNLLLAHEDGMFVVNENSVEQVYSSQGTWLFNPVSDFFPTDHVIAGTYTGLHSLAFRNGKFIDQGRISGIKDPLRFTLYDAASNSIWASHPYHGIYRIELTSDYRQIKKTTLYTKNNGLPSTLYNYVFRIKNRTVVATEKGIYEYNSANNKFVKSPQLYEPLKNIPIQYLKEDQAGNIWFVSNKEVGIIDFNKPKPGKTYSLVYFPELSSKVVGGFESIYPVDENNIFIGANKGVFHLNYQKYIQNINKLSLLIGEVRTSGKKDSVIFGGYFLKDTQLASVQDPKSDVAFSKSNFNSIHFEYASTLYEQQNNIQFSYQLAGFDKEWSAWSEKSEKDYTNLPAGKYIFKVKARNNLGNSSDPVSYTFEILPAWYQSTLSYLVYFLLLVSLINLIVKWQHKRHLKEQEKLKYLYRLEVERNENEIVKLQNEKLEADVNFKNKELASTTMHLVQRGKVLAKIKEVVSNLAKMPNADDNSSDLKQISRLLNEVEKRDADWDQFSIHFDHVHSNFLSEIKERHPNLTPNELKLCAYLKMNLSSKEIAQLMSITIRAVEVSRYRLRKKLGIPSEVNLFDYLMQTIQKDVS
ncbi:triple tyrosine motif-containing protein [Daejeonella oryzae]|uniref:triple tyrosine motif-containing protein n=1 Tax=Daejeonella oryzae TaxID=1122943 RepID=UPI0004139BA5|nr:triple tyrosine motif-containing protein [Daejeonella oryzae]